MLSVDHSRKCALTRLATNHELHGRTGVVFNGLLACPSPVPREFCRYPRKVFMFRPALRTILILVSTVCGCVAAFCSLSISLRPFSPPHYARYLNTAPELYAQLDDLSALDFGRRIYIFDENQFVDAISGDVPFVVETRDGLTCSNRNFFNLSGKRARRE